LYGKNFGTESLQIDTDLLRITSNADELFGGTNFEDLERS